MKSSLLNTNPWLLEPARRAALLRQSAASSSAIEGIVKPFRAESARTVSHARRLTRAKSSPERG
ncbi:MAG TPA: hypothetical protein PKZ76_15660 [Xanthomonadaceae bacterium]|nr:hypothetical protein [Xanthomonadaceae bacterium]